MSSLADLGFTETDYKVQGGRRLKIKQIVVLVCLVAVFIVAVVALSIALHSKFTCSSDQVEADTSDGPSTQELKQKDFVALPEGSLYGTCKDKINRCENQATCLMVGTNKDHHLCLCTSKYYGRFCQHKIIPQKKTVCNNTVCKNSGTCIDVGEDEYACLCPYGYHGNNCQDKLKLPGTTNLTKTEETKGLCYNGMCMNAGTCLNVDKKDFACLCQYGYKGSRCEQKIIGTEGNTGKCVSNVCENGGTCLQVENEYACICKYGYFGTNCQRGLKSTTFRVTLSKWENYYSNKKTIKWNTIISNPGGCYDESTGIYKAMISGLYQFTVQKYGNNKQGSFNVLLDNRQIIYTRHKDNSENFHSATSTFIVHLRQGQQVLVQNEISSIVYGTHINGYISSWFEGHLLYPD